MTTIGLSANDQLLAVTLNPKVTSGQQNTVDIHVEFSDDWDRFAKSAVFFTSNNTNTVYEKVLTNGECIVPAEVMSKDGILYIGVRGVNSQNNEVKTTSLVKYKISEGSPSGTGTEVEPTPDIYQQLLSAYGKTDNAITQEVYDRESAIATEKTERQTEIAVERNRITNLATLGEGSTTGDAELIDARVGYDGTVYTSLGEAVRGQCLKLKDETIGAIADVDIEILYDAEKCTLDKYLAPNNGTIGNGPGDFASDFMPLKLNTDYAISRSLISYKFLYLYDETKAYIGYVNLTSNTFNITENTLTVGGTSCASVRYFRISGKQNNDAYKRIMVVYGTELPTEYTKYARFEIDVNDKVIEDIAKSNILVESLKKAKEYVGVEQIKDDAISCDKTDFLSGSGEVLFDVNKIVEKTYIDFNTGAEGLSNTGFSSDFIPLQLDTDYSITTHKIHRHICLYREDKTYIGSVELTTETFNISSVDYSDAKYFRFSAEYISDIDSIMLVYGTKLPHEYTKFANYNIDFDYYFAKYLDSLTNRWNGKKISVLGDSITVGLGVSESNKWTSIVEKSMYLSKLNNYGVSSTCVTKKDNTVTNSFVDRVTEMNTDSDLYIVFGGINDFRSHNTEIGAVTSTNTSEFCGALNYIIEQIYGLNPNAEIVFMTPIKDCSYQGSNRLNNKGQSQKDFRDAIISVALRHSIPVIDLFSMVGINDYNKSIYLQAEADGYETIWLHPNETGCVKLAKVIATALRNI